MAYIWSNYSKKNNYWISLEHISPYMEVWKKDDINIYVNIYYRLIDYFFPLEIVKNEDMFLSLQKSYKENQNYQALSNFMMHFLAQLDRKKGFTYLDFLAIRHYKEIQKGCYGSWLKENIEKIKEDELISILWYLAEYNYNEQKKNVYGDVLLSIFQDVNIYYENNTERTYIYLAVEKTEQNIRVLEIIDFLFKDLTKEIWILWKYENFGVIGWEKTMRIGEFALI